MTVYIVQQGAYSSRDIVAVFSNKSKAELFCANRNSEFNDYDGYDVIEWGVDDADILSDETPTYVYKVELETRNGKTEHKWVNAPVIMTLRNAYKLKSKEDAFYILLDEDDRPKARKIADDKVAEINARKAGIA